MEANRNSVEKMINIKKISSFVFFQFSVLFLGTLIGCWVTVAMRNGELIAGNSELILIQNLGISFSALFGVATLVCVVFWFLYRKSLIYKDNPEILYSKKAIKQQSKKEKETKKNNKSIIKKAQKQAVVNARLESNQVNDYQEFPKEIQIDNPSTQSFDEQYEESNYPVNDQVEYDDVIDSNDIEYEDLNQVYNDQQQDENLTVYDVSPNYVEPQENVNEVIQNDDSYNINKSNVDLPKQQLDSYVRNDNQMLPQNKISKIVDNRNVDQVKPINVPLSTNNQRQTNTITKTNLNSNNNVINRTISIHEIKKTYKPLNSTNSSSLKSFQPEATKTTVRTISSDNNKISNLSEKDSLYSGLQKNAINKKESIRSTINPITSNTNGLGAKPHNTLGNSSNNPSKIIKRRSTIIITKKQQTPTGNIVRRTITSTNSYR